MTIKQGVILASGLGSRLNKNGKNEPKPMMPLAGMPLILRNIELMKNAGIETIVVVTGYKKEMLKKFLKQHKTNVKIVENDEFEKSNGISLLKSKKGLEDGKPFLLSMVDHVFSNNYMSDFLLKAEKVLETKKAVLAIDRNIDDIFDIDDATKVFTEQDSIIQIDKKLKAFNAIDTGLFLCSFDIFSRLQKVYDEKQDCSISDGMKQLADEKLFGFVEMTGNLWQDVDTPGMKQEAEKRLIDNVEQVSENTFFSEKFLISYAKKLLLATFSLESFLITYIPLIASTFFMLFLIIGIKSDAPIVSVFLFSGVVFYQKFMDIKQKLLPFKEENDITKSFLKDSVLLLSVSPILFNTNAFFTIIFLFFLLLIEFYPMLNAVFGIKVPLFTIKKEMKNSFFSYSFAVIIISLMLILHLPSFLTILTFSAFFAVNKLFVEI